MANTYLTRTPSSAGDTKKVTFSFWVKRGSISANQYIYMVNQSGNQFAIKFGSNDKIDIFSFNGASYDFEATNTRVLRDTFGWYHICINFDTTQASLSNRLKIFINGEQDTVAFPTGTINQDDQFHFLKNGTTNIGKDA